MSLSKIILYRNYLTPLIISPPTKRAILIPSFPPYWTYSINKLDFYYECIFNDERLMVMNVTYPKNSGNLISIYISNKYIDEYRLDKIKEYFKQENIHWYKIYDQNQNQDQDENKYCIDIQYKYLIDIQYKYRIDIQYNDILDIPIKIHKIKRCIQKIYIGNEYENKYLWTCMEIPNTRGMTKRWYRENDELSVNTIFDKIYFRYTIGFEKYIQYIEHFNNLLYDSKISQYYAGNKIVFVVPKITKNTLYEKVNHYWIFLSFFFNMIEICSNNLKKIE